MAPTKKYTEKIGKGRKNKLKVKKVITKEKRTHFQYAEEALAQALNAIRTENMAIREACRKYGVPRSTVQDRISGRMAEKPRKVGPEPLLGFDGEQKVVDWIIDLAKCGIPVNKQQLLETVKNIIKDMGESKKLPEGKKPGQTWYQNFLRRHPEISVREPESINKARESVKESSIRKWFSELESFIAERGLMDMMEDPDRILNADETGVALCPATGKVLAPKGYKNVYTVKKGNEKETLTVLITMTASGKICPPLVVFPYVRPPKAVVKNMPEGWVIGKTESGWMRTDVFYEYIANDFNNWLDKNNVNKPVILFVDGHKSHMSMALSEFCENNDIILYALPPNTTHITQPADVSVFRPLKQEWKKTVSDWQSRPENHNTTITKTNFCKVFQEALDKDLTQSIKNGFRKCGLFPFNVEAIDFTKCVKDFQQRKKKLSVSPSELTERDFISACKVIAHIKTNLLNKAIDADIVCKEIELAKNNLKEKRRSTSKTPRNSTEVSKHYNSNPVEQSNINKSLIHDANVSKSILEDITIPNIGSFVSLNELELINISDLELEHHSNKHSLLEITTEPKNSFLELEKRSSSVESIRNNLKMVTVAEVHNEILLTRDIDAPEIIQKNLSSTPISNKENEIIKLNNEIEIEILHEDDNFKENILNTPNQEMSTDPFEKHLAFVHKMTDIKTKTKNITKFPSAISSKKWRDYYESKEKVKQKNIDEKEKRKMEREIKKSAKKQTNAEQQKQPKTKQIKETKKSDPVKIEICTEEKKQINQQFNEIKDTDKIRKKNHEYSKRDIEEADEEIKNDRESMKEDLVLSCELRRKEKRPQAKEDLNIQRILDDDDEDYVIF